MKSLAEKLRSMFLLSLLVVSGSFLQGCPDDNGLEEAGEEIEDEIDDATTN